MKTWLITGCSSGFGRRLAMAAAEHGDRVVATARDPGSIADLAAAYGDRMIALPLDVTNTSSAASAVQSAVDEFGYFDVLVNNAGYGHFGAIEEGIPEEYRPIFDVNVFGLIKTTKAVLPVLRRRGGTIVNLSSGAGIAGSAGGGNYNAAKLAVGGLSEALADELKPFGIRVIIVEPGRLRTDFLGRSLTMAAKQMPEYEASSGRRRRYREPNDGVQAGDPVKAVEVILRPYDDGDPPLHLPLGSVAYETAERKFAAFRNDMDAWRDVAIRTDFDLA
ncbi:dehydrogenase [Skermanella stibiiresistens SB22]|uniref:Dehydrogenase n=1 Tax=Skermanella stibiiresistens SB22 TaxID=1385369 RepID=W9GU64_9PROT|nr:oxidoreductase [Skermanella stibiiresistens]EWY36181.1 dehydrogenase [Skermanella stibiiresistens SB22]